MVHSSSTPFFLLVNPNIALQRSNPSGKVLPLNRGSTRLLPGDLAPIRSGAPSEAWTFLPTATSQTEQLVSDSKKRGDQRAAKPAGGILNERY